MNGPEHYEKAEELLKKAHGSHLPEYEAYVSRAQVHATLALAAATAMQPSGYGYGQPEFKAWDAVAGVQPQAAKGGNAR